MSSTESTLNIVDKKTDKMKTPAYSIDRGWSWVVLASVTSCLMIIGLIYVIGIFNIIFLEVFGESRQLTAWISVPQTSLIALAAPLSGLLEKYLGSRLTVIVGGLLGATGFFLSYFATSFLFVFLTFGIIVVITANHHVGNIFVDDAVTRSTQGPAAAESYAGLDMLEYSPAYGGPDGGTAHGIVYKQLAVLVAKYFKQYRNLAFGILSSGAGLSSLVLPSIINVTNEAYGWRGCMLIMSGIYLQIVICGSLLRPQPILPDEEIQLKSDINPIQTLETGTSQEIQVESSCMSMSNVSTLTSSEILETTDGEICNSSEKYECSDGNIKTVNYNANRENCQKHVPQEQSQVVQNNDDVPPVKVDIPGYEKKYNLMHVVDGRVIIMIFSVFCFDAGTSVAFVHFPDYFKQHGTSEQEMSVIYIMIGVCSFTCRLLIGVATNSSDISALIVYTAGGGIGAVFLLLCPLLAPYYWGQIIFGMGFSFYNSIFAVLIAPVTVDIFSIEKLSLIYTFILVTCGISSIAGPPIAGWLFDITQDFQIVFIITGVIYMAGALSMMIIPLIKKTD